VGDDFHRRRVYRTWISASRSFLRRSSTIRSLRARLRAVGTSISTAPRLGRYGPDGLVDYLIAPRLFERSSGGITVPRSSCCTRSQTRIAPDGCPQVRVSSRRARRIQGRAGFLACADPPNRQNTDGQAECQSNAKAHANRIFSDSGHAVTRETLSERRPAGASRPVARRPVRAFSQVSPICLRARLVLHQQRVQDLARQPE